MDKCEVCGQDDCVIKIMYVDLDGNHHVGHYCQQHGDELQADMISDKVKVKNFSVYVYVRPRSEEAPWPPKKPENPIAWLIRRLTNARP